MFSNLKSAFQKALSKEINGHEDDDEDIQAIIILLLEACQIDGATEQVEINFRMFARGINGHGKPARQPFPSGRIQT